MQADLRGHGPSNRQDVIDIFWIGSLQLIYGKLDERSVSRDPGNGGAVVARGQTTADGLFAEGREPDNGL